MNLIIIACVTFLLLCSLVILCVIVIRMTQKNDNEKFMKTSHYVIPSTNNDTQLLQMLFSDIPLGNDNVLLRIYRDEINPNLRFCNILDTNLTLQYSYYFDKFFNGQTFLGYDQYSTYYVGTLQNTDDSLSFRTVKYWDDDNNTWGSVKNPWVSGNNDTNSYGAIREIWNIGPLSEIKNYNIQPNPLILSLRSNVNLETGNIGVFRLDKFTSLQVVGEGNQKGGCLDTYLYSVLSTYHQYGILRIAIPNVYMTSDIGRQYDSYDVQYFSVSSNQSTNTENLPFWTVNAKMFKNLKREANTYINIFFAPKDQVKLKMTAANQYIPPIVTWGNREGYLLQTPSYAFIFRYKQPNPLWPGSPIHAKCYDSKETSEPIENELIGPDGINWCPSIFADNFDSLDQMLNSDFIGNVPKNGLWPS